jgi:hypothetical protein
LEKRKKQIRNRRTTWSAWLLLSIAILCVIGMANLAARLYATAPRTPILINRSVIEDATPALTTRQWQRAITLTRLDQHIAQLTKHHKYTIEDFPPPVWTLLDGTTVGGVIYIRFPKPTTITGTWLDLQYPCSGDDQHYTTLPYIATRTHVTYLIVIVDLRHDRVAEISPDTGNRLESGTLKGEPMKTDC